MKAHSAEAASIDETQLAARTEGEHAVGVSRLRNIRIRDEQAAGHAEMHKPLQRRAFGRAGWAGKIKDDGLAHAVDFDDPCPGEDFSHF